ncbi:MAG TPA: hypothetical protein VJ783_09005 [Pirellulales bacterium]|nr:hypothetical protein [Pirellulales bacterium]
MSRQREVSTWPFVVVLSALFLLSVAAPRSWEKIAVRAVAPGLVPGGSGNATDARESHPIAGHEGRDYLSESEDNSRPIGEPAEPHPKVARQEMPTLPVIDEPSAVIEANDSDVASEAQSMAEASEAADDETPAEMIVAEPQAPDEPNSELPEGPAIAAEPTPAAETEGEPSHSVPRPSLKKRRPRPQFAGAWGAHEALLAQLDQLAWNCHTGEWAGRIADLVRELGRIDDANSPRALVALGRLRDLTERDHPLLTAADNQPEAAALRRIRYAILRRLEFWEMVPEMATQRVTGQKTVSLRPAGQTSSRSAEELAQLLSRLERFEQTGLSDDGRELAAATSRLATGDGPAAARLTHWLESNYRNSNLRIVVSADLLNRFVPKQPTVESPVRDRILGVPTRGWSSTTAQLGVRLLPDAHHVRLALEVRGLVLARTTSKSGPVTIYSHSDSTYLARKVFQLGSSGVETWPAEAAASHSPQLRGVETDYDDVPVLGWVVEGIARVKHAEKEGEVRRVARRKVITRVQEEIDAAVEPRLTEAKTTLHRRVLTPLDGLALEPTVIDLRTSENRATMRFRLAADGQLAACTPRPMALADSVASLQIHQSLLNNIGDRLGLDGQTFSLPELQQRLLEAFQLPPQAMTNEFPPDLRITFAKRDSLSVRFADGRVELTLSVAELRKYPKSWRNFQVRVHYKPQARGLDARFVRDGTVQLWGQRFGNQPQIALRGIFSKVFSHDRDLRLVDDRTLADPRLNGLSVTQCVVTDGWLGLSLGPTRSAAARREVNQLH